MTKRLDERLIASMLGGCPYEIHAVDTIGSTNDELKRLAAKGEKDGYMLFASHQTAGRGRQGRVFFSPPSGLYASLLLRPMSDPTRVLSYTTSAAVAVCRAIESLTPHKAKIKWVNDIYLGESEKSIGRKVCGILAESSVKNSLTDWIVIGIGINIFSPKGGFPTEIKDKACALFESEACLSPDFSSRLAAGLALELWRALNDDYGNIINEYRSRSVLIGRNITFLSGGKKHFCRAVDIDDDAALIARYEDGTQIKFQSGEVSGIAADS